MSLPARARGLMIDQTDTQRIWVGVEVGGVIHTQNDGKTWTCSLPGGNLDIHMILSHPERPEVIFASTGYGRLNGRSGRDEIHAGVYRSDDYGASWTYTMHDVVPQYTRPMCFDPRPPFALTIATAPLATSSYNDEQGAQAMLFRSEDSGNTWCSLCDSAHSPSRERIHGLAVDSELAGGVIIGTDMGNVQKPSGHHWLRSCRVF